MANGEWLTQLMAGLGGAFTGATQAKSRMAEEQEAQRKKMELENERARVKRIQELRGGPFSAAARSELLKLGDTPSNIAALQEMYAPEKPKSRTQYDPSRGGIVDVDEGTFRAIPGLPPRPTAPRDRGLTPEEEGVGLSYLDRWFNTPVDPAEKARREQLWRTMRGRYGQASPGTLGYYIMQGESAGGRQIGQDIRNRRASGATGNRPTGSLDED